MMQDMPPVAQPSELDRFFVLLAFITDAKAVAQRMSDIQEQVAQAAVVIGEAKAAKADLAKARTEHEAAIKKERGEHDQTIAEERARFAEDCERRDGTISDRLREVSKLEARAKADAEAAAKLKADLQTRLDRIKSAVAA